MIVLGSGLTELARGQLGLTKATVEMSHLGGTRGRMASLSETKLVSLFLIPKPAPSPMGTVLSNGTITYLLIRSEICSYSIGPSLLPSPHPISDKFVPFLPPDHFSNSFPLSLP